MAIALKNNAESTLATAVNATDTGLVVAAGDGAKFASLSSGDHFYLTLTSTGGATEIVKVTARVGDTMTIVRAQQDTTGQSFAAGSRVEQRITAGEITEATSTNVSIISGTIDGTVIGGSTPAAATFTSFTATTADINGGSIDGTAIGATSASTGNFSTLSISSTAITATATELNILDGVTATSSELNILDGVTATSSELNVLDGITATTTELNYTDGVTSNIQTQLDAKAPLASPTFTGTVTTANLDSDGSIRLDGNYPDGAGNVAIGNAALCSLDAVSPGNCNTAVGASALTANTTGYRNTASGYQALCSNTTGFNNTASGAFALCSNTTGNNNTATGYQALVCNTTGSGNVASGFNALVVNTTGSCNTANGYQALNNNTTGNNNTATGYQALVCNTTGSCNVASGFTALRTNTTGCDNVAMGRNALCTNTTGCNNIGIGVNAGRASQSPLGITTESNKVVIGNNDHDCFVATCAWQTSSDCRDKTDVTPTCYGLNFVRALNPVEYKWDKRHRYDGATPDGSKKDTRCSIGFLAQEVLAAEKQFAPSRNPIIVSDDDPDHLNLGETRIIPALVRAIQEQQEQIDALKTEIELLKGA